MPEESDATNYRKMFRDVWRELCRLRSSNEALLETVIEELPLDERVRVLDKYETRRAKLSEEDSQKFKESCPDFVVEAGQNRSSSPPDGRGGSP
jgi:hypothetical protein